jgi:hypothetical protein
MARTRSGSVTQEKEEAEAKIIDGTTENDNDSDSDSDAPVENVEEKELRNYADDDDDDDNDDDNDDDDNDDDNEMEEIVEKNNSFTVSSRKRHRTLLGSRNKKSSNEKNELTKLIPGYTAPMRLDSSSLDKYRVGSMKELGRRAQGTDASTKDFGLEATVNKANNSMQKTKQGFLPNSYTAAYSHFKRGAKRAPDDTAGIGWFGMKPSLMTDDLKTDLAVIRNRTYLDPKRFYKSADKNHKIVQVGTVIEGASEFYSSRLTKKERRSNLTEELMADPAASEYTKKKFKKMAEEKSYQAQLRKRKPKRSKKLY